MQIAFHSSLIIYFWSVSINGFQFFGSYAEASSIRVYEEVRIVTGVIAEDGTLSIDRCCELGSPIDFDKWDSLSMIIFFKLLSLEKKKMQKTLV